MKPHASLGEICRLVNGKAFKPTDWGDAGLPIVRIQNLRDREKPMNFFKGDVNSRFLVNSGDVLLSWSGTPSTSFGCFIWDRGPAVLNQHIFRVELASEKIERDYFVYAMNSKLGEMISRAHGGVGLRHITKGELNKIRLPLPPLDEQRRIVGILNRAEGVRRLRDQANAKLRALIPALFIKMFGDPVENPMGWEVRPLGDIVDSIDSGWSPRCGDGAPVGEQWGVLKLSAVTGGLYRPEEVKAIKEGTEARASIEVKAGDLLFTRKNTRGLVGSCAYVWDTPPRRMMPDTIFRLNTSRSIDKVFMWALMNIPAVRPYIEAIASGSASSMPNISKSRLRALQITVPPIDRQRSFANLVDSANAVSATSNIAAASGMRLSSGLMSCLFAGAA